MDQLMWPDKIIKIMKTIIAYGSELFPVMVSYRAKETSLIRLSSPRHLETLPNRIYKEVVKLNAEQYLYFGDSWANIYSDKDRRRGVRKELAVWKPKEVPDWLQKQHMLLLVHGTRISGPTIGLLPYIKRYTKVAFSDVEWFSRMKEGEGRV